MRHVQRIGALIAMAAALCGCKREAPARTEAVEPTLSNDGTGASGALRLVYAVDLPARDGDEDATLEQAAAVIRDRLDRLVDDDVVVAVEGGKIVIELPGVEEETMRRLRELIARPARLDFHRVEAGSDFMARLAAHVRDDAAARDLGIEAGDEVWMHPTSNRQFTDDYLRAADRTELMPAEEARARGCEAPPVDGEVECLLSGRQVIERYLEEVAEQDPKLAPEPDHLIGYEHGDSYDGRPELWRTYYLHRTSELAGTGLRDVEVTWNDFTDQPDVRVEFDDEGRRRFGALTSAHVGEKLAIVLDGVVASAPIVREPIPGGKVSITMGTADRDTMMRQAQDLATALRSGSLPAPVTLESEDLVGAP